MPERPVYDGFSKTSLHDPERLRRRTDVVFREETRVVNDAGAYNGHEAWAGRVAVGVVADDDVLLVNAPQGWSLPVSPVRAGDDWAAVGRRWVAQKTGRAIDVEAVERVTRVSYRFAGAPDRQTTGYDVVFRARPADRETPMDHLARKRAIEDGDEYRAEWFGSVPEGVADDGFRCDVAWFVGE